MQRLPGDERGRARERRRHGRIGEARATGHLEALLVPRLHRDGGAEQPALRGRDQFGRRHDLVDQTNLLCFLRGDVAALEQVRQRLGDADQPRHALRATAPWQQAHLHLGQAHEHPGIVRHHAVVAGETQLESAAERQPVDRGDPRLAAGLDLAQQLLQAAPEAVISLGRRVARSEAAEKFREVIAGDEAQLARGDDDTLDGGVGDDAIDDVGEFGLDLRPEDVHRAPRAVHRDERDAVRVDGDIEMLRHCSFTVCGLRRVRRAQ